MTESENLLKMQVAISMVPSLNTKRYLPLIEKCGSIERFFSESTKNLDKLCREFNMKSGSFDRKKMLAGAEEELNVLEKHRIQICTVEDHFYPELLYECEDAPLVFFHKGDLCREKAIFLAIVGTRKASARCEERVDAIVKELAETGENITIVSGLAFGIDASAHQAAIKYGLNTYAVLGHGLNTIYPAAHRNMAEKIIANGGALITEFPCRAKILPVNFLQRNRIIAGLCQATLIGESTEKGGAMTTARIANSYGRDIYALPGRPEDKMSAGCNLLIKENIAALIENGDDLIRLLGIKLPAKQGQQMNLEFMEEDAHSAAVIKTISEKGSANIDELSQALKIPVSELSPLILKLELEGKLISLPGNSYIVK